MSLIDPAINFVAVTPHDTNPILGFRALYIGTTGDVAVKNPLGTVVTFVGVLAGTVLPIQGTIVMATGTSATNIIAIY